MLREEESFTNVFIDIQNIELITIIIISIN